MHSTVSSHHATGWVTKQMGFNSKASRPGSGTQPASYSMCIRGSFPRVQQPECQAGHLPSSSANDMNVKHCTSTTLHTLRPIISFVLIHQVLLQHNGQVGKRMKVKQGHRLTKFSMFHLTQLTKEQESHKKGVSFHSNNGTT